MSTHTQRVIMLNDNTDKRIMITQVLLHKCYTTCVTTEVNIFVSLISWSSAYPKHHAASTGNSPPSCFLSTSPGIGAPCFIYAGGSTQFVLYGIHGM